MHEYSNILFKRKIFKIFLELKSKKKTCIYPENWQLLAMDACECTYRVMCWPCR